MNSNSLEYEDVLYFDFQPHPMACTLGSVVMESKQTLFEIRMFLMTECCDINISLNKKIYVCDFDPKVNEGVGAWGWYSIKFYQLDPVQEISTSKYFNQNFNLKFQSLWPWPQG